jgi:hypothetical protein
MLFRALIRIAIVLIEGKINFLDICGYTLNYRNGNEVPTYIHRNLRTRRRIQLCM